jgi:5-methyltetrahydrofolate--homocysteine methyltransferase
MNDESKENYTKEVRAEFEKIRQLRANKDITPHLSIEQARNRKINIDWGKYQVPIPRLKGNKVFDDYPLDELIDYIDWSPFFHAWELKGLFPRILDDLKYGNEAQKLFNDGKQLLDQIISEKILTAKAVIGIHPAYAENESVFVDDAKFYFPRQTIDKGSEKINYCLADFIAPKNDFIGLFAVTAGYGLERIVKKFEDENDDYNAIMAKVLADRLAEALAERIHERVRKEFWGYENDEKMDNDELIKEKYQGIRPAPGYPACPSHEEKDKIWSLLKVEENTGIKLTETRAMYPAAAVCGWYFSNPNSQYFSVGNNYK